MFIYCDYSYNNLCVYYFIKVIYDKVFEYKLLASIHVNY